MWSTKSHLDETRLCTLASNQGRRIQTLTRHSTGFFSQFSCDIALYIHAVLSIVTNRSTIQTLCTWHMWDAPETSELLVSNRSYNATAATKKQKILRISSTLVSSCHPALALQQFSHLVTSSWKARLKVPVCPSSRVAYAILCNTCNFEPLGLLYLPSDSCLFPSPHRFKKRDRAPKSHHPWDIYSTEYSENRRLSFCLSVWLCMYCLGNSMIFNASIVKSTAFPSIILQRLRSLHR